MVLSKNNCRKDTLKLLKSNQEIKDDYIPNKNRLNRKNILFIDEVDSFFSESFYGQLFNLCEILKSEEIT